MEDAFPTHPGVILRDDLLPSLHLSVGRAAAEMGVARQTIYRILAGQAGVTPEMALRLGRLSGTRAEMWLTLQQRYDLWRAKRDIQPELAAIPAHKLPRSSRFAHDVSHDS